MGSDVEIRLKTPTGEVQSIPAFVGPSERGWTLKVTIPGLGLRQAFGPDLFECLLRLRAELEPLGYRTLVDGARRNAWPSGMARDMAGGRKAYLPVLGQHGHREDMVDIFGPADEADTALVHEQRAFSERWLAEVGE